MQPLQETSTVCSIKLNIGGASFAVTRKQLLRYPKTRLGQIASAESPDTVLSLCDGFVAQTSELYFDRSQLAFDWIINLYRNDVIHMSETWCPNSFLKELDYWQVDPHNLSPCCFKRVEPYLTDRSRNALEILRERMSRSSAERKQSMFMGRRRAICINDTEFLNQRFGRIRKKTWIFLENPASSKPAMIFSIISLLAIVATVLILILSSFSQFRKDPEGTAMHGFDVADGCCVVFFSAEYLLRLWSSPDTLEFVKNPISIIDLVAVLPFYLELVFEATGMHTSEAFGGFKRSVPLVRMLRVLRLLRVLRVLKVARYSQGFQSMGSTLKKSYKELVLLILFMTTANILFSTVMYFLEMEEPKTKFRSIPDAAWWCVITMTTVGYGDIFPTSVAGKVLAGIVSVSGVILLAFPISVIVENFNQVYNPEEEQNG